MKNWEKYEKEINEIGVNLLGVTDGEPVRCASIVCSSCDFNECITIRKSCSQMRTEWLYQDDEIRVGDVVKHKDSDRELLYVTVVGNHLVSGFGISHSNLGEVYYGHPKQFYVKTGKHITLDKVIELIGGTN